MRQAWVVPPWGLTLSRALMVSVTPHGSLHKFTLVRDYLSCTIEFPHLASGLGNLDAVADEDGPAVDAEVESEDQRAPSAGELV
jgi:hypothetical protein